MTKQNYFFLSQISNTKSILLISTKDYRYRCIYEMGVRHTVELSERNSEMPMILKILKYKRSLK